MECRYAKVEYAKVGTTFKEIAKVGAINCMGHRGTCREASIDEFPAFRWFPFIRELESQQGDPEVFEGPISEKAIAKWVNEHLPDHTTVLKDPRHAKEWLEARAVEGMP